VAARRFDAVLIQSFGGPEKPADVVPFLENVLQGRPVAPGRIEQIASHYMEFGGRSPINEHNRALVTAVSEALAARGRDLPVYWGNRNWDPYLAESVSQMAADGIRRAAVFATSAYASYSGCRQYLDDLAAATGQVGPGAPELWKIRPFFDRTGFTGPLADGLGAALAETGAALATTGAGTPVLMTAHSIPTAQAQTCDYEKQLSVTAALVAAQAGVEAGRWCVVYQSRSGPPGQPWLGPDVVEAIDQLPEGTAEVIVVPIGFVSDHMEVVYDLDRLAAAAAAARGIRMVRTSTPGVHPSFVAMVCDLIEEAEESPLACETRCCPAPAPRPGPTPTAGR
jgi:ferrochelatase